MRIGILLLAVSLLLSGCSTSTQVIRKGFAVAQQMPSPREETVTAGSNANVQLTAAPSTPSQTKAPRVAVHQKTKIPALKSPISRVSQVIKKAQHVPIPVRNTTWSAMYSSARNNIKENTDLDKDGCACIGLALLAALLTIAIALAWKAIFGKGISVYGMILIGVILVLIFIFIYDDHH